MATTYGDQVVFLAIGGNGSTPDGVAARAEEWGLDHYLWTYAPEVWDLLGVPGNPYTMIIGRGGELLERLPGEIGSEALAALLAEHGLVEPVSG